MLKLKHIYTNRSCSVSLYPCRKLLFSTASTLSSHPSAIVTDANANISNPNTVIRNPFYVPPAAPVLGNFLKSYGINLNKLALEKKLDPVLCRDEEIDRAVQILSRRTKNNPCFIGDAGVGKTSIAEGLALRIVAGNVPNNMKNRIIISLDLASVLAGTKFRGEFEERMRGILDNVERAGERVILFIDEIHIIAGAGAGEGGIDASNIMKPALARGSLRCMGATTSDEYRRYIEKDSALARRFQAVSVPEPSVDSAIKILHGLKSKYEIYHNITITDNAITAAVKLSHRYIPHRRLPDKAIDVIDEAASKLRLKSEIKSADLLAIETSLASLRMNKIEQGGKEETVKETLDIDTVIETLKSKQKAAIDKSDSIHELLGGLKEVRVKINSLDSELSAYLHNDEIDGIASTTQAIRLQQEELHTLIRQLEEKGVASDLQDHHIADIIAKNTGINVGSMLENERQSLLSLETHLGKQVVGQEAAISAISKCIRISRAGLRFHDRPLGVFLLLGSTGSGKTELAKALSEFLFHDAESMLRLDMSEYMERFNCSRLIGSPPGYVGYEQGGILTEAVRRKPYQVILLDEFEKAHREVGNLLLQVFDEGRLTDSHGNVVDFKNTVIIMTSNLGGYTDTTDDASNSSSSCSSSSSPSSSSSSSSSTDDNRKTSVAAKEAALQVINGYFSPEFVNRLDDVILFSPLSRSSTRKICDIQLKKVTRLLADKGIAITVSDAAYDWLAVNGYSQSFGARPLKRLVQTEVLTPLSTLILEKRVCEGQRVHITSKAETNTDVSLVSLEVKGDHLDFYMYPQQ